MKKAQTMHVLPRNLIDEMANFAEKAIGMGFVMGAIGLTDRLWWPYCHGAGASAPKPQGGSTRLHFVRATWVWCFMLEWHTNSYGNSKLLPPQALPWLIWSFPRVDLWSWFDCRRCFSQGFAIRRHLRRTAKLYLILGVRKWHVFTTISSAKLGPKLTADIWSWRGVALLNRRSWTWTMCNSAMPKILWNESRNCEVLCPNCKRKIGYPVAWLIMIPAQFSSEARKSYK